MSLKTDCGYNEDDFVEENGCLNELTVTITLCEYRNLIEQCVYDEKCIERLKEENKALKEASNRFIKCFIKNKKISEPVFEAIKKIADALTVDF